MIILIKYNNRQVRLVNTYLLISFQKPQVGRCFTLYQENQHSTMMDQSWLEKLFLFSTRGKISRKDFSWWDFFYPVGNIDVQFQGLYFGLHASKMLLAPLPPDTSGGNQPPTIEYKRKKEVFLFTNNTNLAQTIQSKYLYPIGIGIHVYIYNNTPIAPIGTQQSNIGTYSVGILCVPKCTQIVIVIIITVMVFTCL